ncbi:MAG: segregation and condensation protein A [Candidatus Promineifilaceae bacterium]
MSPESPTYRIDVPAFSGPLDLLLQLIERQELDITAISLARVTEQYLQQIEALKKDRFEELIDFLVIGARLVLIKSRALLPQESAKGEDGEEEEDPAEALLRQLRRYRQFKQAAAWLGEREKQGLRSYLRVAPPPRLPGRLDMNDITIEALVAAVQAALAREATMEDSVSVARPRILTIQDQIRRLRRFVNGGSSLTFDQLLSEKATRAEIAVSLLAVLELIKRREVKAVQEALFGTIAIVGVTPAEAAEQAPVVDELLEFDDF